MRICLLAHSGSTAATLSAIAAGLVRRTDAEILVVDSGALNLVPVAPLRWVGPGRVVPVGAAEIGLVQPWSGGLQAIRLARAINRLPPVAARQTARAARFWAGLRPDIVIACTDVPPGSAALLRGAIVQRIGTVLVQEGPFVTVTPPATPAGMRLRAGHRGVLAASGAYRDRYARSGVPAERIAVVGLPKLDALPPARTVRRSGPLRLLYVFQPFVAQRKAHPAPALAALAALARALTALHAARAFELVVRAHPRADPATMAAFTDALGMPFVHDAGERPLPDAALGCDAVVGHYSVGLLEAVAIGVPALCWPLPADAFIDAGEAVKQDWIAARLPTPGASFVDDAGRWLARGIIGPGEIDIGDETGVPDGIATERACAAILGLLEDRDR